MTQIITSSLLLISVFFAAPAAALAQEIEVMKYNQPITLEQHVREYFEETPILAEIAKCESRFRQFNSKGNVLRGEVVTDDVGLMQINEFFHAEQAKELGFDIHTVDGNMEYAKYLYEKQGTQPWSASKPCWKKAVLAEKATSTLKTLTLKI